jgi:hypothetical protein
MWLNPQQYIFNCKEVIYFLKRCAEQWTHLSSRYNENMAHQTQTLLATSRITEPDWLTNKQP